MRFLHTSDLHIGITLGGYSLLDEQRDICNQIIALAAACKVDGVILAGDIFDRAVTTGEAIGVYDDFLTKLSAQCNIYLIAGNHDGAARLTQLSALLRGQGVFMAGVLQEKPAPIERDDAQIWLIPYFHIERVRLLYPDLQIQTMRDAMLVLMDDIRQRKAENKACIVVGHCFVTGADLSESDTAAQLGGANMIDAQVFHDIDYVALGHLHRPQSPAPNVHYAGSPYPYSFSEGKKSIMLYDTALQQTTRLPLLPKRPLEKLVGTYEEILFVAAQNNDAYVCAEITDRPIGLEVMETIRAVFPRLVTLTGQNIDGVDKITITAQQVKQLTPEQLLIQFCEETGGMKPDESLVSLFLQALEAAQMEVTVQ